MSVQVLFPLADFGFQLSEESRVLLVGPHAREVLPTLQVCVLASVARLWAVAKRINTSLPTGYAELAALRRLMDSSSPT